MTHLLLLSFCRRLRSEPLGSWPCHSLWLLSCPRRGQAGGLPSDSGGDLWQRGLRCLPPATWGDQFALAIAKRSLGT